MSLSATVQYQQGLRIFVMTTLGLLLTVLPSCTSFVVPSSYQNSNNNNNYVQPQLRRSNVIPLISSARIMNSKSSMNDDGDDDTPLDEHRRNMLSGVLGATTAGLLLGLNSDMTANAGDFGISSIEADAQTGKIVMGLNSNNLPVKNAMASTREATYSTVANRNNNNKSNNNNNMMCVDPEERRIAVFERTAPSVVFIDTFTEQRDAFSTNVMEVPLGSGSGFVWDEQGHIVTNYHVVRNARSAQIAFLTKKEQPNTGSDSSSTLSASGKSSNFGPIMKTSSSGNNMNDEVFPYTSARGVGQTVDFTRSVYKARVVGVDPGKDIAVLKVDAPAGDLYPINVGTSTGLRVGQSSLAIGNPFGLDHTLTSGVISGIGREVRSPIGRPITNVIQTDAAINPGNSGGPLLDGNGRLIGMNTAIYSPSGGSAGIGFAIPVDAVKYIVDTLIRDGQVVRAIMGVSLLESKQARALGINKGVLVLDVPTDSPAFRAGMKGTRRTEYGLVEIGDIITKVNNTPINKEADLFEALEKFKPGDTVTVIVNRVDRSDAESAETMKVKEVTLNITLKASSSSPQQILPFPGHPDIPEEQK